MRRNASPRQCTGGWRIRRGRWREPPVAPRAVLPTHPSPGHRQDGGRWRRNQEARPRLQSAPRAWKPLFEPESRVPIRRCSSGLRRQYHRPRSIGWCCSCESYEQQWSATSLRPIRPWFCNGLIRPDAGAVAMVQRSSAGGRGWLRVFDFRLMRSSCRHDQWRLQLMIDERAQLSRKAPAR